MCISAKCYNKVTFMRVQPGMPSADAHPSGRDGLRPALFCYYPERRKAAGTWALKRLESVTTTGLADNAVIHGLFAFSSSPPLSSPAMGNGGMGTTHHRGQRGHQTHSQRPSRCGSAWHTRAALTHRALPSLLATGNLVVFGTSSSSALAG